MTTIKNLLRKTFIATAVRKARDAREFLSDYAFYSKFNTLWGGGDKENSAKFELLLHTHVLEKGLCTDLTRPFGFYHVDRILFFADRLKNVACFEKDYAVEALRSWKRIFTEKHWLAEIPPEISAAADQLIASVSSESLTNTYRFRRSNLLEAPADYLAFVQSRHSARRFSDKGLSPADVHYAVSAAMTSPSACNRQMCKVHWVTTPAQIEALKPYLQGIGGIALEHSHYFVLTFDMLAFERIGERNQGWLNVGLFAMNFVNALHSRKIGSCFIQWANSNKEEAALKRQLGLNDSERIGVVVVAGAYPEEFDVPASRRKSISEVLDEI